MTDDLTGFKKGDRVKVTVEGLVTEVQEGRIDLQDGWSFDVPSRDRAIVTIEKVSEPEPTWSLGDLILVTDRWRFFYTDAGWVGWDKSGLSVREISKLWQSGDIRVLCKAPINFPNNEIADCA